MNTKQAVAWLTENCPNDPDRLWTGTDDAKLSECVRVINTEHAELLAACEHYAVCGDGCTCGDGWSHDVALAAIAKTET